MWKGMHFERPVETNALLLTDALDGGRVEVGVQADGRSAECDVRQRCGWVHPRADVRATVPTNLIRAVLQSRNLMLPPGAPLRVVSVPELCAQVAPVAYMLQPRDVEAEVEARGPVLSTLPITPALLGYWSALLRGETLDPFDGTFAHVRHGSNVLGSIAVAILGHTADYFIVGLPWGATCDTPDAWGVNGCMRASKQLPHLLSHVVAMCDSVPPVVEGSASILVLPLTPPVLQRAVMHSGKLPKKIAPVKQGAPAPKPKVKVKANLNTGSPPPKHGTQLAPLLQAGGGGTQDDVRDKVAFIVLGVLCVAVMVVLSIFLAKNKVRRAPKKWTLSAK